MTAQSAGAAERLELGRAVRGFLAAAGGTAHARRAVDGADYDRELWRRAAGLGIAGLLVPEGQGGQGADLADMAVVAGEFGRVLMPSPLVGSAVFATRLLGTSAAVEVQEQLLPLLATGELVAAVALLDEGQRWTELVGGTGTQVDGDRVTGTKTFVVDADQADVFLVVASQATGAGAGRTTLGIVQRDAPGVHVQPTQTLDPTRRLGRVEFRAAPFRPLGEGQLEPMAGLRRAAREATAVACAESVGAGRAALERTVEYISLRRQFDRVIGSFQAVKHLAATVLVEIELAGAATEVAIRRCISGAPGTAAAVGVAKIQTAAAVQLAAREGLHLHGGIGFTAEHDIHLYLRRAKSASLLFGNPTEYRSVVAEQLRARVPGKALVTSFDDVLDDALDDALDDDGTPGDVAFAGRARSWLAAHAPERNEAAEPPFELIWHVHSRADADAARAWNKKKYDAGWAGLTWPKEYGGQGLPPRLEHIWRAEVLGYDTPEFGCMVGPSLAGPMILKWGTPEQKAELIPAILDGTHIWTQLFSEPDAGSDLASLRTSATREEGGRWRLRGQKVWSSVAQFADRGLLLARTDPGATKHRGISCFVVDMAAPGITVRPIRQINGESTFNEVFLDEVVVSSEAMVGPEGEGWSVALGTLANERVELGTRKPFNFDRVLDLARRVGGSGRATRDDPAIMNRLVDVYVRLTALDALGRTDGGESGRIGPIVKLVTANLMSETAELCLDMQEIDGVLDGADALDGGLWQRGYLGVQARRIAGGTDEIQRNLIAERLLGLPREPRPLEGGV